MARRPGNQLTLNKKRVIFPADFCDGGGLPIGDPSDKDIRMIMVCSEYSSSVVDTSQLAARAVHSCEWD
jgi:hypothetical protein